MKLIIWLCVVFGFTWCFGQNKIDSLQKLIEKTRSESERKRLYSKVAWHFFYNSEFDSAIIYYNRALAGTNKNADAGWQGDVHFGLGACYGSLGRPDSAVARYKTAIALFASINDSTTISQAHINLSFIFKDQGLYEEALSSALKAITILKKKDPNRVLAYAYNNFGIILLKSKNHEDALTYYEKSVDLLKKSNDKQMLARLYNNIGELHMSINRFEDALTNLSLALELKQELNDRQGIARTLNNLGKVSMIKGDVTAAQNRFDKAIQIHQGIDDPIGKIEVLNNIGELSIARNNLDGAAAILGQSEAIIRRAGTPDHLRQNLELQVRVDRQRGDWAAGMAHLEQLLEIRDSLLNKDKSRSLQAMQLRYESEKMESEIEMLQQREEIHQTRLDNNRITITALVVGLLLTGVVGLLIYLNFRNARAARIRFELLLAETRHRIKNNFQTLASIFNLQTRHYTDHNMVLEARTSESRVHAMSLLHDQFSPTKVGNAINTRPYIVDLVDRLVNIYGYNTKDLRLEIDVDDALLDIDKALALSLIIQELACNAFKHAFENQSSPILRITVKLDGKMLVAIVHDNGKGLTSPRKVESQGFSLIQALADQLNGTVDIATDSGTRFTIRFPANPTWKEPAYS